MVRRLDFDVMLSELSEEQWDELEAADRLGLIPDNRTIEQRVDQNSRRQSTEDMETILKARFGGK